jgi:SNF family Na+-dependent transporter
MTPATLSALFAVAAVLVAVTMQRFDKTKADAALKVIKWLVVASVACIFIHSSTVDPLTQDYRGWVQKYFDKG